jgi:hypothetical protein
MGAKLTALAGPLEGENWSLEGETTIGWDKTNHIAIDDQALPCLGVIVDVRRHDGFR